jgi:DNA-binding MarR family transcriptional regulator
MDDKHKIGLSTDNLRTLLFYLSVEMDNRLAHLRKNTAFKDVRPADARLLVLATRKPSNLSEIAEIAGITRQAVHLAVQRLERCGLLTLENRTGDRREKIVTPTDLAWDGVKLAGEHIGSLELELATALGREGLELLRSYLKISLQHLRNGEAIRPRV